MLLKNIYQLYPDALHISQIFTTTPVVSFCDNYHVRDHKVCAKYTIRVVGVSFKFSSLHWNNSHLTSHILTPPSLWKAVNGSRCLTLPSLWPAVNGSRCSDGL